MTKPTIAAIATALLLTHLAACKKVEKKRRTDDGTAATSAKPAPVLPVPQAPPTRPGVANPHASPGNVAGSAPHGVPGSMTPPMPMSGSASSRVGPTGKDGRKNFGPFSIVVPKTWKETPPVGSMRLAQWSIGSKDPGELAVFSFPGGGGVDANINRWIGQFVQEDGSPSSSKAVRKDRTIDGLPVSTLRVEGRFVAAIRPGAAQKHNKQNYKLLASIITVGKSAYFFKLVGPKATLDAAGKEWDAMVASIKRTK